MMDFEKHAYIVETIRALKERGSWCGKTHVQKSLFLIQQLTAAARQFQFVLYKHGPYSFEVEADIEQMKSYGAINIEPIAGYGVVISLGDNGEYAGRKAPVPKTELQYINLMCERTAGKTVSELERLATVVWVRTVELKTDDAAISNRVHELKPHISSVEALAANSEVNAWLTAFQAYQRP